MSKLYRIKKPVTRWDGFLLESTESVKIDILPDGRRKITATRKIQKALEDGTPILDEGPPPPEIGSTRVVERYLSDVVADAASVSGISLSAGLVAGGVAGLIDKWADEDAEKVVELSPLP